MSKKSNNDIELGIIDEESPVLVRQPSYLELDIKKKLYNKKQECKAQALKYKKAEQKIRLYYYLFSGLAVILSVVISSLSGTNAFNNKSGNDIIIFVLSSIVSVSAIISSFFDLETKSNSLHTTSTQLDEISLDLDVELCKKRVSNHDYEAYYNTVNERYKLIYSTAYSPKASICCCD